jgi:hypothetical protein
LRLTQERDAVTGPFTLRGIAGTLAGTVDQAGQLTATAALTLTVDGSVITFNVPTFAAHADGERLSGACTIDVTAASLAGQGHLDADLQNVARAAVWLPLETPVRAHSAAGTRPPPIDNVVAPDIIPLTSGGTSAARKAQRLQ